MVLAWTLAAAVLAHREGFAQATWRTKLWLDPVTLESLATFPSARPRSLEGGEMIFFKTNAQNNEVIVNLPLRALVPFVHSKVTYLAATARVRAFSGSENDPYLCLSDGRRCVGIMSLAQGAGGELHAMDATHDGKKLDPTKSIQLVTNLNTKLNPVNPTWRTEFAVFPSRDRWLEVGGAKTHGETHYTPATPLARTDGYDLLLFANNSYEEYAVGGIQLEFIQAEPVADSEIDFSGQQGHKGWHYGYYVAENHVARTYHPDTEFGLFRNFSVARQEWYDEGGSQASTVGGWFAYLRSRDALPNQQGSSSALST